jgi:tripartite-type tricarboxylate transporter receptor subunit TctC
MARSDLPFDTLKEVVAEAKAKPRTLTYASAGNGSGQHVLAAALWHLAGVELVHVPYRGAQAAYQDLLGGRVDLFFDLAPTASRQIAGGRAKALASSGGARNPAHPDLVTIRESGVAALELESWFGLFAPAGTPPAVLEALRKALAVVSTAPDVTETFIKAGGRPLALDAVQTRALVAGDVARWTALIRDAGITAE